MVTSGRYQKNNDLINKKLFYDFFIGLCLDLTFLLTNFLNIGLDLPFFKLFNRNFSFFCYWFVQTLFAYVSFWSSVFIAFSSFHSKGLIKKNVLDKVSRQFPAWIMAEQSPITLSTYSFILVTIFTWSFNFLNSLSISPVDS